MTQPSLFSDTPLRKPAWDKPAGLGFLAALLAIFGYLLIRINVRISDGHSGDFRHFYWAADAMLRHKDLFSSGTKGYLYPPLIAFLYTPVVPLGFVAAQRVMLIVNTLLTIGGILLVTSEFIDRFEAPKTWAVFFGVAFLGALMNVDKIRTELQMFQTNATMFFMFALSLRLLDRRPWLAGAPLGFIFNIKYLSIGMLPWLLIRRRWGTAVSCVVSTVFFAILPTVISGWGSNNAALATSYGGLLKMVGIHTVGAEQANVEDIKDLLSCSITSAMARTPLNGGSEKIGLALAAVVAFASLAVVVWLYLRNKMPLFLWPSAIAQRVQPWKAVIGLEFVTIVAITLVFSPQTNTRHLLLVLLITIPAAVMLISPCRGMSRTSLILAMAILFVGFIFPFGNKFPHLSMLWFGVGGQCWCLLLAVFTLMSVGLNRAMRTKAI
jgi:hypothetical protein